MVLFHSLLQLPLKEIPQLIHNEATFGDQLLVHLMRPPAISLGLSTQLVQFPQRESNTSSTQYFRYGGTMDQRD